MLKQDVREGFVNRLKAGACFFGAFNDNLGKLYNDVQTDLLTYKNDSKFTNTALSFIFLASNEFMEDHKVTYGKELTMDFFGQLLKGYREGDGERYPCG